MKTNRNMKPFFQGAVFSLLAVLLAGCDEKDGYKLAFSHHLHVTENEIGCADCHGKMTDGHFANAGHKACTDCHEEWIKTKDISAKTCGMCHKVKDLQDFSKTADTHAVTQAVAQARGVFVHTAALSKRCAECHGSLLDKKQKLVLSLTGKEKIRIREEAHQWGLSCSACHEDMDPQNPPLSHSKNWMRRHGPTGALPDNTCGMCHTKESCRECHQVTQPVSHNNLWRMKTHGIQAAWDRERCLVCHQQDSCTTCHEDTRPLSHKAGWSKSHCLNCHPSQGTGTGCTLCHETNLDSHPNPHAAGWRDRHCFSCHEGSPAADQCRVCHGPGNLAQIHDDDWTPVHDRLPAGADCYFCHGR